METIDEFPLPQRVVLLSLATLQRDDETPARVNVITRRAQSHAETIDDVGKLTEAEVDRALNTLEAEDVVTAPSMDGRSPVGKGRPAYELGVEIDPLLETLAEDDRLEAIAERATTS